MSEKIEISKKTIVPADLEKTPSSNHIVNVVKAAISGIPIIGCPISSLVNDYIPNKKLKRLLDFTKQLSENIERFKDEIDEEFVKTDEFAYLFEQTYKLVLENYQKEKLDSLMALLVNSLRGRDLKSDTMEYYLKKIATLSPLHLGMLRFLSFPVDCFAEIGIKPEDVKDYNFSRTLQAYFRDVPLDVLKGVFGDLHQMGFTNTDQIIFGALTAGSGVGIISGRVSSLGKDFMKFCTLELEK
ncbi:MAG: hypothetical protein WBD09_07575 [Halobacteriota archaeon]